MAFHSNSPCRRGRSSQRRLVVEQLESRRVLASGDLDLTFGAGGKLIDSEGVLARDMLPQEDGTMLVAGQKSNGSDLDFALLRYDSAGQLDLTFGPGGTVLGDFGAAAENSSAYSVAVGADGKIVVAGLAGDRLGLARFNANGTPDLTFSGDGKLELAVPVAAPDVALQENGRIVVVVGTNSVYRFNVAGGLDSSFSDDGVAELPIISGHLGQTSHHVAMQQDGKIVVSGKSEGVINTALWRLNDDGTPDATFQGDNENDVPGASSTGLRSLNQADLLVQPDGNIFVVGMSRTRFRIARFDACGDLTGLNWPTNFQPHGQEDIRDEAFTATFQDDGKLLLAGRVDFDDADPERDSKFGILRLNSDLSVDKSFSFDGKVEIDFQAQDAALGLMVQDGKILVGGYSRGSDQAPSVAFARIDGSARPENILLSDNSVPEHQPAGTVIGTLSAVDDDPGDTFTYSLVGVSSNRNFQIVGDELRTRVPFDFETQSSYPIRVRVTDSFGNFFHRDFTITVEDDPTESPVLGGIGGSVGYTNNAAAVRLAPNATVTDTDAANYAAARLIVEITGGADAGNRLLVAGTFKVIGGTVQREGITYATVNSGGGVGTTRLELTFNANATQSVVQQILRSLYFRTSGPASSGTRTIAFTLFDADGNASNTPVKTVNVTE